LKNDPNAEVCSSCDGFGIVKLPSHVPNNQMRTCSACNGAGYRELNPQSGTLQAPTPPTVNGDIDVNEGVPLDDPSVIDLRSRGFMVMKVPALGIEGQ
jgi:DnaJ-class molecular chaperone